MDGWKEELHESNQKVYGQKGILLAIALTALLAAGCGSKKEPVKTSEAETSAPAETATEPEAGNQELPNPMVEVEDVLAFEAIGVHMVLPEGAEDTSFSSSTRRWRMPSSLWTVWHTPTGPRIRQRTLREFSSDLRMRPLHRTMITVKPAWRS